MSSVYEYSFLSYAKNTNLNLKKIKFTRKLLFFFNFFGGFPNYAILSPIITFRDFLLLNLLPPQKRTN